MSFQGLTIIAFNGGRFDDTTLKEILSLAPTYVAMMFLQSKHLFC